MELERAIELALDGAALLFVGAGFSQSAINVSDQHLMGGGALARHLAVRADLPENTQLEDAAEVFCEKYGDDELIAVLKREFTVKEVSASQTILAEIDWKRIYTTNYDNVVEAASAKASRAVQPVTLKDDIHSVPKDGPLCVHLNGFIDRLSRDTISTEIKLTETSYVTESVSQSSWALWFRQDIQMAKVVFFVGYSLWDLDLRRVLAETDDLKAKCVFIIGSTPDASTARRVARYGTLVPMDLEGFADAIRRKRESYIPREFVDLAEHCVCKYKVTSVPQKLMDKDVFNLLLYGNFSPQLIWQSLHGDRRYYIQRGSINIAYELLKRGASTVVIHSNLGNGKSLVLEGIKCRAYDDGYAVYTVTERGDSLFAELEQVLQSSGRVLVAVEEYSDWLDVIRYIGLRASDTTKLVLTARTAIHDVLVDDLCDALDTQHVSEVDVDRLRDGGIDQVVRLFDEYGLWGESASAPESHKYRILAEQCNGEFHAILLRLLKSPDMIARLKQVIDGLNQKRDYYEVMISILVLVVMKFNASMNTLVDIWGPEVLDAKFGRNPAVRQLVDIRKGQISLRSAVAGKFILSNVANINLTVDTLIKMAVRVDWLAVHQRSYQYLMVDLMRFSDLQELLPEEGRRPAIIRYYDSIKNLHLCARHPLFWLQYAIACLAFGELDRAERYFQTAYSYAEQRRPRFDTFQIDNHWARFLLRKAIAMKDATASMEAFREAREIVNQQILRERLDYPYRVASLYADFYDTWAASLTDEDRGEVVRAAQWVSDHIDLLPYNRREKRAVVFCRHAMERIIEGQR